MQRIWQYLAKAQDGIDDYNYNSVNVRQLPDTTVKRYDACRKAISLSRRRSFLDVHVMQSG
jgi:hypothetical protein